MMNPIQIYDRLAGLESRTLSGYLDYIVCDSRPPKRMKNIIEPWQRKVYDILVPMFETAAGIRDAIRKNAYIVAPRGHSKTSTVAQLLNWLLCYSVRPITVTAAAADKDQAAILIDRMKKEAGHNAWLKLKFRNYTVIGPMGVLDVVSSDAATSYGKLDDLTVIDEITNWKKKDLFDVLISGKNKRKSGVMVIIGNAGEKNTWQHALFEVASTSPEWITHEIPAYSATWMDMKELEEQRKLLIPAVYRRVHENIWIDMTEENGFISKSQITECIDKLLFYRSRGC